jgi:uncharacterized membrane protein
MDRRILLGALFASVALNVFIGGAFVGAQLQKARTPPAAAAMEPASVQRNPVTAAIRTLPPERQAAWRDGGPEHARTYGPKAREARRLAREAMRSFGEEPFDRDAAVARLARARGLEHEVREAMDRRLVDFAATLPPDERRQLGEALARPRLGRGGAGQDRRGALPDR